ncbi:MAG: hypothetical protein LBL27_02310, partial [Coriobacteriales bacterium]|nr:hypothetical protein [Coriobacteriales bacterium]
MTQYPKDSYPKRVYEWVTRIINASNNFSAEGSSPHRYLIHCLGFGSFWAWNFCMFWSELVTGRPHDFFSGGVLRVESLIAIVVTLLIFYSFSRLLLSKVRFIAVVAAIVAMAGTVLSSTSVTLPHSTTLGFVLVGSAYAMQELLWSRCYDRILQKDAWKITVPGSMLAG